MQTFQKLLAILALVTLALPVPSSAQGIGIGIGISIHVAPPALPVYVQPELPGPGLIWTPGYWAYGEDDYFWVPGTWIAAPTPGYLWTPGYWGFAGGAYGWHGGYWGAHVGFYGGVNYGFGYGGAGFAGGEWRGGVFAYNRSVANVGTVVAVNNTYTRTVVVNNTTIENHASFNGGTGGTTAQPTEAEKAAASEPHVQPTAEQASQEKTALANPQQKASVNGGKPAVAATPKAGQFSGKGVVTASKAGAPYKATNTAGKTDRPATATSNKSSTVNSNKPAASTNKPATATSTSKPVTATNKPATSTSKPATASNKPATASNKPAPQKKSASKPPAKPAGNPKSGSKPNKE
jgi:hypothetical protein